jgi:hypothetical protein
MKKSLISAAVFFVHASAVGLCLNVSSRLLAADEEARLANPSGPVLADLWRPFPCSVVSRASEFRHDRVAAPTSAARAAQEDTGPPGVGNQIWVG